MVRLAINGFGRIGRAAFKIAFEQKDDIEIVAINDLGDITNLAYLLRYDSIYGRYMYPVTARDGLLVVGDKEIAVTQEKDPAQLPWHKLKVDVVIESTGVFTDADKARLHIKAGAKHVIISAPTASEGTPTIIRGVNSEQSEGAEVVSSGSCTTNCAAVVTAVIEQAFGIELSMLTTVHAYTATQSLTDQPAQKDWRRGRMASVNIVPSTTGASEAVVKSLPQLSGKMSGVSLRVPVTTVSICDCTYLVKRDVTVDEVNQVLRTAADSPLYENVLAVTDEPTVSTDFIGDAHSAIVDVNLTSVVGGKLVKVMAWYDNEWGYANRLIDQVLTAR
jgi:glyceraldehyde 3-phosphate dehydrogenase